MNNKNQTGSTVFGCLALVVASIVIVGGTVSTITGDTKKTVHAVITLMLQGMGFIISIILIIIFLIALSVKK